LAEVAGSMVIAGHGPEQHVIESLAHAFEKANPRAYIDVAWDDNSKPLEMLKAKQANIAVTGNPENGFRSVQIAWDGIAIMVHRSNFTKEVTKQEVAELFSGKYKFWADLGGPDTKILLLDRPRNENNRDAFEQLLGITGKIPDATKVEGTVVHHVDEKLGGRRVRIRCAGHGDRVGVVLEAVVRFIRDRRLARLLLHARSETAALNHEAGNHTMENRIVVVAGGNVIEEVLGRQGRLFGIHFDTDNAKTGVQLDHGFPFSGMILTD
jgi:hypothetical protein